jgi:hypothetical protein
MHGQISEWVDVIISNGRLATGGRNGMDAGRLQRPGLDAPLKVVTTAQGCGTEFDASVAAECECALSTSRRNGTIQY